MATLILPCAGKSTRFENTRPKWSLTHPYGELMLIQGIKGLELDKYDKIIPVFLKEHLEDYGLRKGVIESFNKLNIDFSILELDSPTKSQSETVAKAIEAFSLKGSILICNPVPKKYSIPNNIIEKAINSSMLQARQNKIHGKALTPFLLEKVSSITKGKTLETNIQLMLNNAKLAARIAFALNK